MGKAHKSKGKIQATHDSVITGDMRVIEVLTLLPEAGSVFAEYGLHCAGCTLNTVDTLEEGMKSHGHSAEKIHDLIDDLNTVLAKRPEKPQIITLTKEGALHLGNIAKNEKREGEYLEVSTDEQGGFCLEFRAELPTDALQFVHKEVPDVIVIASPLTLSRIGGATIDFRDDRFKLDLDEEAGGCCQKEGGCGCKTKQRSNTAGNSRTCNKNPKEGQ